MTPTPPEPAERPSSGRRGHLAALAIIGGVFALMACLRSPLYNTPTYDDWTYLLPTLRLASTGVLRYVRYNNACVLSQVFLGAAWLRLVGIQVGHLRVLTLLLSYATIVSAYGILRELGLRWRQSLAGALVLLACPHYVFNSYSWMSDVPALAFLHLSLWAYLAGLRRHSGYLWAGAACAVVAILTRQTSMGVPVAVLMYLAWRRHRSPAAWLAALLPVVVGMPALVLVRRIPDFHQGGIPSLSLIKQYAAAPNALALGLAYFSFVLLPLGAAYAGPIVRAVRREPGRWLVAWVCWLAVVAALAAPAPRLGSSPVWRYDADPWLLRPSTFMWRGYIHGFLIGFGSPLVPLWVQHVVSAVSLTWLGAMLAAGWARLAAAWPWPRVGLQPRGPRLRRALVALWLVGVAAVAAGQALWQGLAERGVRAAFARGMGQGRGLDYWLAASHELVAQASVVVALLLVLALGEMLWQRLAAGASSSGSQRNGYALWSAAELLALAALVGFTGAAVLVLLLRLTWRVRCLRPDATRSAPEEARDPRRAILILVGAGFAAFIVLVLSRWEVYDRHFLPIVFPATFVALWVAGRARFGWLAFAVVAALRLGFGLVGTDVYAAQMIATDRWRTELIEQGVPPKALRAGLELDGFHWRYYVLDHPDEGAERLKEEWPIHLVPVLRDDYIIAGGFHPTHVDLTGYEIWQRRTFKPRLWPWKRPLYVLRRAPAPPK